MEINDFWFRSALKSAGFPRLQDIADGINSARKMAGNPAIVTPPDISNIITKKRLNLDVAEWIYKQVGPRESMGFKDLFDNHAALYFKKYGKPPE